ncbi:MAG: universal stress protein, partial [Phycisphaerae bacterium]|nr:universal stress protein [Phycisphaerae bacterium]NIX26550.1 universal stress protein [Phycisphaerae bacterium]
MGCVVCATRGGEGSRAAQEAAIRYARENQYKLIFMYVVDFKTLDEFDDSLLPSVREELTWLGQSLLRIARHRAEQAGVTAEIVIREGDVMLEIEDFLQEIKADQLILGAPRGTTANVFGDDSIEKFAQSIQ